MRAAPRGASAWRSERRCGAVPRAVPRDIGRLTRSEDFERVLRSTACGTSAHFAIHHVAAMPSRPGKHRRESVDRELSTTRAPIRIETVDDLRVEGPRERSALRCVVAGVPNIWLGCVVPKRHARRAVTRSLLRREIRAAVTTRRATLPEGLWVVRLRAGFDRSRFPSASSDALRQTARAELASLVERCVEGSPGRTSAVPAEPT